MKVFIAIFIIIATVAGVIYLAIGDGGNRDTSALIPTPSSSLESLTQTPEAVPTPNITVLDGEEQFEITEAPLPTIAYGPYLVASDALGGGINSANQGRVLRTFDDIVALLYHRPSRSGGDLQEIVMVHSHDNGQSWHDELIVGTESAEAAYSGVMDSDGNIHVAFGKDAPEQQAGAIKVLTLSYDSEDQAWTREEASLVVWDWPEEGSSTPVLALTGERLWLGYVKFQENGYSFLIQYADPDDDGKFANSNWSEPINLIPSLASQEIQATLFPYQDGLSLFYTKGESSQILWRSLTDAQGSPESWKEPKAVSTPLETQSIKFSVTTNEDGNIHLVTSSEGIIVSHTIFNGTEWTRPSQLAVNNVYGPSVASDGQNIWTFWVKKHPTGYNQIQLRRWVDNRFWERTTSEPWATQFGMSNPSVLLYRARSGSFTDITRYAATLASAGSGPSLAEFFERVGDYIYVGNDTKFKVLPLSDISSVDGASDALLEYWNGSQWVDLPLSSGEENGTNGHSANGNGTLLDAADTSDEVIRFVAPADWQTTEVDGQQKYYLRVNNDAGDSLRINPLFGLDAPIVSARYNGIIDVLVSEDISGEAGRRLWYGAISTDSITSIDSETEHVHKTAPSSTATITSAFQPIQRPEPLPLGSPRQYTSVEIDEGETYKYQLIDGQIRNIRVLKTDLKFRSTEGVTVWGTALIEVTAPDLTPERAEIPAAYFQAPVTLNDVRIFVEITEDFNDFRLSTGGGTSKSARLMLSDGRYSMTDLASYRWPFPGMLWGLGGSPHFYQGLSGSAESHAHNGYFSSVMPANSPVIAWHDGTVIPSTGGGYWRVSLDQTEDGRNFGWHKIAPLSELDPDLFGGEIKLGQEISALPDVNTPRIAWGSGVHYDWAPLLAEWYMAESTPIIRSFVKDWLVLGTFTVEDSELFNNTEGEESLAQVTVEQLSPLDTEYIPDEKVINPFEGEIAPDGLTWKRYDNIVPGVINIEEAVSDYPNSGWSRINRVGDSSVAYLATYVHTPFKRQVVFNIGSSDPIKVWVGDEVVFEKDTYIRVNRNGEWSIVPDAEKQEVWLEEGWNRVLIKVYQDQNNYREVQSPQNSWQLTFRISDKEGNPLTTLSISPEMEKRSNALEQYSLLPPANGEEIQLARPPERQHSWPETANLAEGENYIFTKVDGSIRTLTLISYDVVIPRHLVTATVKVEGDGKEETHTLKVSPGGIPVSVNGLKLYAYVWKEADDQGFEKTRSGAFPLEIGKDVGFAVNDSDYTLFPNLDEFAYPYDTAFNEGEAYQSFLEPSGSISHAGVDIAAPDWANLRALRDGVIWYNATNSADVDSQAWLSTTTGGKFDDPRTWFWSHLTANRPTVPNGSFVEKGTVIFEGATATHMGPASRFFDFGSWSLLTELWNYFHRDDFPAPRYWLVLGPYPGDINTNLLSSNESGDLPSSIQPMEGAGDRNNEKQWQFVDNQVTSVVRVGELVGPAPYSGHPENKQDNALGYLATYVYADKDYSTDEALLTVGASRNAKLWINGKLVFDSQTNDRTPVKDLFTSNERFLVTYVNDYDVPIALKKGWNTLIAKTDQGASRDMTWVFTSRIGDPDGNRLPNVIYSTRNIDLKATTNEDGTVDIDWTAPVHPSMFTDSYRLDVALDSAFTQLIVGDFDLGRVTSHTIEGLGAGTEYYIRVKPYNSSEMGGSTNWQYMDVVTMRTPGEASSESEQSNETVSVLAKPGLEIISPAHDVVIAGTSLAVLYSATGDLRGIDQALFDLDGNSNIVNLSDEGLYQLNNLAVGTHTITGWLLDSSGNKIEETRTSNVFDILSPSDDEGLSWLSTNGNRIVDEGGDTVILRGVNIANREWVWEESQSIEFERRAIPVATGDISEDGWGANIITLEFASGPVNRNNAVYLENIDELVNIAKSNGAYTLLVYRYNEPNDNQVEMPDQAAQNAIAKLAERYRNEPAVIYGLQVEPHRVAWEDLKPRFTSMVDAIRQENPRALIAVPGTQFGRLIHHAIDSPIDRPNLVYKTHPYDPWSAIQFEYQLPEVASIYPVLIGEFGAGSQMNLNDVNLLLQFAEAHGISWMGWLFHDRGCPCMLNNTETFIPSPYGTLVKTRLREAALSETLSNSISLSQVP